MFGKAIQREIMRFRNPRSVVSFCFIGYLYFPLDFNGRWYGILAFDYPIESLHEFLQEAKYDDHEGTVLLYDKELNPIATSAEKLPESSLFSAPQLAQIASAAAEAKPGEQGELRMDSRFITWAKLNNFDGLLVKVHTLEEGVHGEFGRIRLRINTKELLIKKGNTTRISASFGVSSASEFNDYDFERLQSWADHRLYKAKQGGRNQVYSHD